MVKATFVLSMVFFVGCATPHIPYTTERSVNPLPGNWASGGNSSHVGPIFGGINMTYDSLKVITVHNPLNVPAIITVKCDADVFSIQNEGRTFNVEPNGEKRFLLSTDPQHLVGEACYVASSYSTP